MSTELNTDLKTELTADIRKTVDIAASAAITWDCLLEQIGSGLVIPDGTPMPLTLEAWPGGRYFRDLGNNTGHLWAHVQVIKPPRLLELIGPLMMSHPVINHVQYRITERPEGCTLAIVHRAFGLIDPMHRTGVGQGWEHLAGRVRQVAEAAAKVEGGKR